VVLIGRRVDSIDMIELAGEGRGETMRHNCIESLYSGTKGKEL
jgi:hypothetical protein